MGSYKWVISPPIGVLAIVTPLITPLMIAHEPPSRVRRIRRWLFRGKRGDQVSDEI